MIGLILAAGEGKRFIGDLSSETVKALAKINRNSLIEYSLRNCIDVGIKTAVIVVSPKNKDGIYSVIGSEYCGMEIKYVVQEAPLGLINAVVSASDFLCDRVLLQLGDEIFIDPEPEKCIDAMASSGADFIVTYVPERDEKKIRNNFSIESDKDGRVVHCVEKPETVSNRMKGTGLCIFSVGCLELLLKEYDPRVNYPNDLCDYFNFLTDRKKTGMIFRIAAEEVNVNTRKDLEYAQKKIRDVSGT